MAPRNRVTSILPEPNADGDNVIGITLGDGSTFDVAIDSAAAQTLVKILQRRLHDDVISRYGPVAVPVPVQNIEFFALSYRTAFEATYARRSAADRGDNRKTAGGVAEDLAARPRKPKSGP
jgi:hypothetical protein